VKAVRKLITPDDFTRYQDLKLHEEYGSMANDHDRSLVWNTIFALTKMHEKIGYHERKYFIEPNKFQPSIEEWLLTWAKMSTTRELDLRPSLIAAFRSVHRIHPPEDFTDILSALNNLEKATRDIRHAYNICDPEYSRRAESLANARKTSRLLWQLLDELFTEGIVTGNASGMDARRKLQFKLDSLEKRKLYDMPLMGN